MPNKLQMEILTHEEVGSHIHRLVLSGGTGAQPGQFVQVSVAPGTDPFLMRPLSVHDSCPETLTLLYRKIGRGTAYLAEKQAGEVLTVVGPLGRGFKPGDSPNALLVAGGIGAAPLYYLLRALRSSGKNVYFFNGARTASELILPELFNGLATEYFQATDDGTAGNHGLVTALIQKHLTRLECEVYTCGPAPMMREVARLARAAGRPCQVSLEARMACGVGACLGCVIMAADGHYRRVCADGPVFPAEEVFTVEA